MLIDLEDNMKKIKIFTYVDREDPVFLPLWLKYYKSIHNADLSILCRNVNKYDNLCLDVDMINVDSYFEGLARHEWVPPNNMFIDFQSHFLRHYDVVIYVDLDEFILHKDINSLLQSDFNTCMVTTGVEIVQNLGVEKPIDLKKPIPSQRDYMIYSNWYNKPLIVNKYTTWIPGKHNDNLYSHYVPGLYLVHLGKVCIELYQKLWNQTKNMYSSSTYIIKDLNTHYINEYANINHPKYPMIKIPSDIKELLIENI